MAKRRSNKHKPAQSSTAEPRPLSESAGSNTPPTRLLLEFASRGKAVDPKVQLVSNVGQVVAGTILTELFTDAKGETAIPELDFISDFRDLRSRRAGRDVQCVRVSTGLAAAPGPSLWVLSREASGVEDPWLFADSIASRVGAILDDTAFLLPGAHSDLYVGGHNFITHDEFVRHVAGQVEAVRLPCSDIDFAATVAHLGSAITWAVTGGNLPPVDFSHTKMRIR